MSLTHQRRRSLGSIAAAALMALPTVMTTVSVAAPASAASPRLSVIIRHDGASAAAAEAAVARAGGTVELRLASLDSLSAEVPAAGVAAVAGTPGVVAVTADTTVRLTGGRWKADEDLSSMYNVGKHAGAHDAWGKADEAGRKLTGKGVGVALIDSGIAPVKGLDGAGKVVNGPDLSFDSQAPNLRHLDTYGHGTHMAGIIAGRDPAVSPGNENDDDHFVGIAPDAHLLNVKVAAADGAVDVSQVIAAIDWVVTHRSDPGLNIRVLNLSFGTDSTQDTRLDPLSHAVEAAWRKGIVVVAAVGNDGGSRVAMPAANPYVIAVGAADSRGTDKRDDDVVAAFSTRGSLAGRRPDLVAPGRSVVSLRSPNSFIDATFPSGRVVAGGGRFFRGSGTSQSTAMVSGAAALLLQQRPNLTPDQVKRLLTTSASAMPDADSLGRGSGQLDIKAAVHANAPQYVQTHLPSTGQGSLELSRGSTRVADPDSGTVISGEVDIMGRAWAPTSWAGSCVAGTAWTGGRWNGSDWTGADWSGGSWASRTWSSRTWSGTNWASRTWSSRTWSGATWSGGTWSSRTWSSRTWSSRTWSGNYWSSQSWS